MEQEWCHSDAIQGNSEEVLTHFENGNTTKAFRPWGRGAGPDQIVPVDVYEKWVLDHREGQSIGADDVRKHRAAVVTTFFGNKRPDVASNRPL